MNEKLKQNIRDRFGGFENASDEVLQKVFLTVTKEVRAELTKGTDNATSDRPRKEIKDSIGKRQGKEA